jgi:hypothetical protein
MIKKIYPVFVAVVFGLGLQSSTLAQTCTAVDAVTTSTLTLTNQSKVCETTASLIFTFSKTGGSRQLVYGKTTSYGTNGPNLINSAKTANLTGLQSGTKYYFKIDGIYKTVLQYTMTGSFTTNAPVGVQVNMNSAAPTTIITIGKNIVAIPSGSDNTINVQLFSLDGTLVFKHDFTVENRIVSIAQELFSGTGTFLCRITGKTTLQNQMITIVK